MTQDTAITASRLFGAASEDILCLHTDNQVQPFSTNQAPLFSAEEKEDVVVFS